MKLNKVNLKGSPFRHTVTHAPETPVPFHTYAARVQLKLERGKVTFAWRIFNQPNRKVK